MAFAGLDVLAFPSLAKMQWLKTNTDLVWTGYYLAPTPSRPSSGWMGQRAALVGQGWGIAPLYVGEQTIKPGSQNPSTQKGRLDGDDAAGLLRQEGFPPGSCAYLDLENGTPFPPKQKDYVKAWAERVAQLGFTAGIYCSHVLADPVHQAAPNARIWAFKVSTNKPHPIANPPFPTPAPSGSGFAGAAIWQREQNGTISPPGLPGGSLVVDLNSALTADPGAP